MTLTERPAACYGGRAATANSQPDKRRNDMSVLKSNREKSARSNLVTTLSALIRHRAEAKRFAAGMATQMSPDGLVYRPDAARSILLGQASDTE